MDLVREIQDYELRFGFAPTNNFQTYNERLEQYSLCFYADKFSLEVNYAGEKSDCLFDERTHDVFVKAVEAVAGIKTPLTRDLVNAPLSRFIMVVFHEDFHEQMLGVPTITINESATTLMGFLLARDFALMKYGDTSVVYQEIVSDITRYLEAARLETAYADSLSILYGYVTRGEITTKRGLKEKERLFSEMRKECTKVVLLVLGACESLKNNADFGVALWYTKYYRLFYELHKACNEDVGRTGLTLSALAHEQLTEEKYLAHVRKIVSKELTCM